MSEPNCYLLNVRSVTSVSAHMKEVVLAGPSLGRFPPDFEGGYVKLLFPKNGTKPEGETVDLSQFVRRSFTVRQTAEDSLTLLFADHDAEGPAMNWLAEAQVGAQVRIAGPGAVKRLDPSADWFLLASDMTGMAALEVNLERLPPEAQGHACIEVLSPEDQRALAHPDGIQIEWIVNPRPSSDRSPLADAVEAVSWRDGRASAWVATEFASMRRIRRYLRDRGLGRDDMYISSYWKLGDTDEGHKAAKKNDGEA